MKTICLANMKGGVEKTPLSVYPGCTSGAAWRTYLLVFDYQVSAFTWVVPGGVNPAEATIIVTVATGSLSAAGLQVFVEFVSGEILACLERRRLRRTDQAVFLHTVRRNLLKNPDDSMWSVKRKDARNFAPIRSSLQCSMKRFKAEQI